jgi:signal transduction histidine kinase
MKSKISSLQWILLIIGITAVVGLTAMNVYSLFTLRKSSVESQRQSKKLELAEFAERIRYRFIKPFRGLGSLENKHIEQTFENTGQLPKKANNIISKAASDSIFKAIYYIPAHSKSCERHESLLRYNADGNHFYPTSHYSESICDGLGIARTRMKNLIHDYRFNDKVLFDTHRSMIIALVNPLENNVIAYLAMPLNQQFMVKHYLQPQLIKAFGKGTDSELNVWLRDWTNGRVIASSDPPASFHHDKIQFRQQFSDFFNNWALYASFNKGVIAASSQRSLWFNLGILAAAFILLIGAMLFMFYTARREQALAKRQSDFLANVTHELKTPISVMQAAGENLADGRVIKPKRLQAYGSHIYRQAVRLRNMIDRLLDMAKGETGEYFIHPVPTAVNEKVHDYLNEHIFYIKDEGFTLKTTIPEEMPLIMLDEHSLHTILGNLISNAMKYSNDDKFLGIYLFQQEKEVILQVEDHGIGMTDESSSHIFEKFYRAEDPLTARTKGYGLGLSIVKNLVDLNGGSISVKSRKGHGSTFTVRFPANQDSPKAKEHTNTISSTPELTNSTN